MLRLIGWIVKSALFAVIVLVIANVVKVGDRTVSDQVKTEIAHAENSEFAGKVRHLAERVTHDARTGQRKKIEAIPASERQKLRALMKELNSQAGAN